MTLAYMNSTCSHRYQFDLRTNLLDTETQPANNHMLVYSFSSLGTWTINGFCIFHKKKSFNKNCFYRCIVGTNKCSEVWETRLKDDRERFDYKKVIDVLGETTRELNGRRGGNIFNFRECLKSLLLLRWPYRSASCQISTEQTDRSHHPKSVLSASSILFSNQLHQ